MQYVSQAPEASKEVTATGGYLRSLTVTNVANAVRYVYVFDGDDEGARLANPIALQAGETRTLNFEPKLRKFETGLFIAASTTQATFTQSEDDDFLLDVVTDAFGIRAGASSRMV